LGRNSDKPIQLLVERVVLDALGDKTAASPPDVCASGDLLPIVFREADPP
jgi:hypothetical protein